MPVRFEIDVDLDGKTYEYAIAFELPPGFKELRVLEEKLSAGGRPVYTRELAQVKLPRIGPFWEESKFGIDWHLVAPPIVQEHSLSVFKRWLARMLILRPAPGLIGGDSSQETFEPNLQVADYGAWFSGLLAYAPAAYTRIDGYLKQVMPDLMDIRNPIVGKDSRNLVVQFRNDQGTMSVPFEDLSDGEKCFMICALVLAANDAYRPLFCFWDEPDSYLGLPEVEHFVFGAAKGLSRWRQIHRDFTQSGGDSPFLGRKYACSPSQKPPRTHYRAAPG